MKHTASLMAVVLLAAVGVSGCRAKREYSCAVTLNTSGRAVTLAQDADRLWYEASPGSVFGAYETTTARAQAQCVDMVAGRLVPELTRQYPEGMVACACVRVDEY